MKLISRVKNFVDTINVTVYDHSKIGEVEFVSPRDTMTIPVGPPGTQQHYQQEADLAVYDSVGLSTKDTHPLVTWTSTNAGVASVAPITAPSSWTSATITMNSPGKADIIAAAEGKADTVHVTVVPTGPKPPPPPSPTPPPPPPGTGGTGGGGTSPGTTPQTAPCKGGTYSDKYYCYGDILGIDIYDRQIKDSNNKYEGLLRLVNTTASRVDVLFTVHWTCTDGSTWTDKNNGVTIQAHGMQSGELDGLWYYPCAPGVSIAKLGVSLSVQ